MQALQGEKRVADALNAAALRAETILQQETSPSQP
jgi:hypothetical protein